MRHDPGHAADAIALEWRGVHKRFGRTEVIRGVDLSVRRGERVAVIGPNGAGKTTLFHLASGRATPDRGEIRLHGQRIDGLAPHRIRRHGLARSFQVSQLFARLSVRDHLCCALLHDTGHGWTFWRRLSGLEDLNARADALLQRLDLVHRRDTPAAELPYAEQRALEIGLAFAGAAGVVLLDEPTAGMSRSETARCVDLIRTLGAGRTLVMVEHDLGVVFELAERVAVLVDGAVIAFDTPERVRADPRVQQAYLGAPALAQPA